jgi:ketosteroid isomerase-like protein
MSQENVEIVRRGYELYEAGDFEGVAELFAEDAEIPDAAGLGVAGTATGARYGPQGFLRAIEETLEAFEDYRNDIEEFIDAGDAVVVPVRISGTGRTSGARVDVRVAHLWFLRDGKVVQGEVHRSTKEALQAAGLSE